MEKLENEEKETIPSEKHYAEFEPSAPPVAPDGGIPMGYAVEQPIAPPSVSPEHFMCLRGPCRHYWFMKSMAGEGNPAGTWASLGLAEPRQHHHVCLVNPGMETVLNDDCVYECSKWDPMTTGESTELNLRRRAYYKAHPEFDPDCEEEFDGELTTVKGE